jgi:hypothetical protein
VSKWINQMFAAKQVLRGGVVRRDVRTVEERASLAELIDEIENRNFHAVRIGEQVVVICNTGEVRLIC